MSLIKSISFEQEELLRWIIQLYVPAGAFDVDATYSIGGFYRSGVIPKPVYCFDLHPQCAEAKEADCRHLPLEDHSVDSMILDPPFLATTGPSLRTGKGNKINHRFGVYPTETALADMYRAALCEAHRVLKPGGILVFKCQDKVSSGKQHMMHCEVWQWAQQQGFQTEDLYVLLAKSRLVANWQRNQKHARKFHCYFWVFRKQERRKRL